MFGWFKKKKKIVAKKKINVGKTTVKLILNDEFTLKREFFGYFHPLSSKDYAEHWIKSLYQERVFKYDEHFYFPIERIKKIEVRTEDHFVEV